MKNHWILKNWMNVFFPYLDHRYDIIMCPFFLMWAMWPMDFLFEMLFMHRIRFSFIYVSDKRKQNRYCWLAYCWLAWLLSKNETYELVSEYSPPLCSIRVGYMYDAEICISWIILCHCISQEDWSNILIPFVISNFFLSRLTKLAQPFKGKNRKWHVELT